MLENLFSKRWTIGGILILLSVIFEIHGSSISIYADMLLHPELSDVILGKYRGVRSDEWLVFTPFAFSQYFNNFGFISDIVRAAPTNMFMTYGQAVWHPAMIFRPAQIGYLFFDQGSGLAFFWTSRCVILFLISFEFARLILKTETKLSIIYAIMIAFSPLAQWWWAVNSIAEILAAGQGVVVCWKIYLEQEENRKRFLYAAGFLWCTGVYILAIYPAWQVSFGYVFLACLIAVSLRQSNVLKILWHDKFFWIVGFAIMLAPIIHVIYISRDMIELQMATEYPGKRFTTGGNLPVSLLLEYLAAYGASAILPFKDIWDTTNNCELASFFSMTPLGFLMFFYLRFKLKQKDFLMTALFIITILFCIWEITNIPDWLAKFSFMGYATDNRVRSAIDFAQLVMVFRGLILMKNFPSPSIRLITATIIAILPLVAVHLFLPDGFNIQENFLIFVFVALSVFLFLSPMNKKIFTTLSLMMLIIGVTVNPINKGVDVIYKMPVGQKISEIVQQDKNSLWIVEDDDVMLNDFPIMFGAPTINSVNVYPMLERWEKFNINETNKITDYPAVKPWKNFDPDREDFKDYNKYAHIVIILQNDKPTNFYFPFTDSFKVYLNPNDLKKLEVKYIFSRHDNLEKFSTPQFKIQKIYDDAGSFIYNVE
ncbi:MAG: hypothetical protein IK062_07405 [Selenomonadaceae bacterium]|nr:hypothetical protein [Selenomonadaceae bacterium]